MTLLPPDVLAGLNAKQRAQVKRAEAALARLPRPRLLGADLTGGEPISADPVTWLQTLWPTTFTQELAPYHLDYWNWIFSRTPTESAEGVFVWPRGFSKTTNGRRTPIALATRGFRYVLYVQKTQEMADTTVQEIGSMLASPLVRRHYPLLGEAQTAVQGGANAAWRRNRVWTRSGLIVDAAGLDTTIRGLLIDDARPDVIILDDIDGEHDSLATTEKKLKTIKSSIIPAGAPNRVVIALQNIISPHGVVTRLANVAPDHQADFMMGRHVSGPFPAVFDLETEQRLVDDGAGGRKLMWKITGGRASWPAARPLSVLEDEINQMGLDQFVLEKQNEVDVGNGTLYMGYPFHTVPFPDLGDLEDVQVWCDIAVTAHDGSDSQAISAAGRMANGKVVTLYAWEGIEAPSALMRRALLKAVELRASTAGFETNQGGDLWRDSFNNTWDQLLREGAIPTDTPKPRYAQEKASAATGGKRERWQVTKGRRERGEVVDAAGTHEVRFRGLKRLPEVKPFDIADADHLSTEKLIRRTSTTVRRGIPLGSG